MVQLNYKGEPISAWKRWSKITDGKTQFSLDQQALEDAERSARRDLADQIEHYDLGQATIIYQSVGAQLLPFFVFDAKVRDPEALLYFPPRRIEIPAQEARK
jgi:hypothetical protein